MVIHNFSPKEKKKKKNLHLAALFRRFDVEKENVAFLSGTMVSQERAAAAQGRSVVCLSTGRLYMKFHAQRPSSASGGGGGSEMNTKTVKQIKAQQLQGCFFFYYYFKVKDSQGAPGKKCVSHCHLLKASVN